MGPEWYIYGSSGHGFDLETHIGVLHRIFMGQVPMVLNLEHIYGSCMVHLWDKWAWF